MVNASEFFSPEEIKKIKMICKMFNGKVVKILDEKVARKKFIHLSEFVFKKKYLTRK